MSFYLRDFHQNLFQVQLRLGDNWQLIRKDPMNGQKYVVLFGVASEDGPLEVSSHEATRYVDVKADLYLEIRGHIYLPCTKVVCKR